MAAGLHGSARTTPRVRAELQASQESTRALAARYGPNPKTVAKWRARRTTADTPMGPRRPRSTVLTGAEEAIIVESRRRTLPPLDDVLGCLRETIPTLSRSALHRCLERHGVSSRLPRDEEKASKRQRFAEAAILAYIAETNADPKPFVWTKSADDILVSVARFCQRTSNSGN